MSCIFLLDLSVFYNLLLNAGHLVKRRDWDKSYVHLEMSMVLLRQLVWGLSHSTQELSWVCVLPWL